MNIVGLSRSFSDTGSQTLSGLLDTSPLESPEFVLDESATNLRDLVDTVIALLVPLASHRELHLRASVGPTVAETIRADSARLGQIIFHMLKRTIQLCERGEILLVMLAQSLNSDSQRIFISVVNAAEKTAPAALPPSPALFADDPLVASRPGDADAYLPLCRTLAQHMRGELSIAVGWETGARAIFNAPFVIESVQSAADQGDGNAQASLFAGAAGTSGDMPQGEPFEPFESRYLDALSEEGVDLHAFFKSWRQALNDDLACLRALPPEGDFDHFHGVLHRLSGSVGLVGALSLMEALRRASTSPLEHNARSVEVLTARARTLVTQLEAMSRANWSTSR